MTHRPTWCQNVDDSQRDVPSEDNEPRDVLDDDRGYGGHQKGVCWRTSAAVVPTENTGTMMDR
jgi:hypothetical protein